MYLPRVQCLSLHLLVVLAVVFIQCHQISTSYASEIDCSKLKIVSRRDWGAAGSNSSTHLRSFAQKPKRVFIHHTWFRDFNRPIECDQRESCSIYLKNLQNYHQMVDRWPDICYNFLISHDGTIYEGVGFAKRGFHTLNYNNDSLGIAFIGNYERSYPSRQMGMALASLLHCATRLNNLDRDYTLHGHRDARCTSCPGEKAYKLLHWMQHYQAGPLMRYSCPESLASTREVGLFKRHAINLDDSDLDSSTKQQQQVDAEQYEHHTSSQRKRRTLKVERLDKREPEVAAISRGNSDKSIIVINAPAAAAAVTAAAANGLVALTSSSTSQLQLQQPSFYILTSSKAKSIPTVLFTTNSSPTVNIPSSISDLPIGNAQGGSGSSGSGISSGSAGAGSGTGQNPSQGSNSGLTGSGNSGIGSGGSSQLGGSSSTGSSLGSGGSSGGGSSGESWDQSSMNE